MEEKKKSFSEIAEGILAFQRIEATPEGIERRAKINLYKKEITQKLFDFEKDDFRKIYFLEDEKNRLEEEYHHSRNLQKRDNATLCEMKIKEVINHLKFYMDRVGEDNYAAMKKIIEEGVITENDTSAAISYEEVLPNDKTGIAENHEPEEIIEPLPEGFTQFTYSASVKQEHLFNDFQLLNNTINPVTHKPFMEIGKIKALLKKNFQVFKSKPIDDYFELSLEEDQKYIMRNFMYQIYKKYKRFGSNKKTDYASFLINNFELFLNAKPKTLSKNMRKEKAKKNLIIVPAWN